MKEMVKWKAFTKMLFVCAPESIWLMFALRLGIFVIANNWVDEQCSTAVTINSEMSCCTLLVFFGRVRAAKATKIKWKIYIFDFEMGEKGAVGGRETLNVKKWAQKRYKWWSVGENKVAKVYTNFPNGISTIHRQYLNSTTNNYSHVIRLRVEMLWESTY